MNSLTALLFPECVPLGSSPASLLTLFDGLSYFSPEPEANQDLPRSLPEGKHLFTPLLPCSDDPDNERFSQLIREMRGRGKEVYLQTLTSIPSPGELRGEEASASALRSLLTGTTDSADSARQQERQKRWQARLVLQLSAMLAAEEEEINRSLQAIQLQRKNVFTALQGLDEKDAPTSPATIGPVESYLPFSEGQQLNLLYAWAYFYLVSPPPPQLLPCTAISAVGAALLEAYEKKTRQQAIELCCLHLPVLGDLTQPAYFEQRSLFRQQMAVPRQQLSELLTLAGTTPSAADLHETAARAAAEWQERFPQEAGFPGKELRIYCLTGLSLASLFIALLGGNWPAKEDETSGNGLLALLSPASPYRD